MSTLSMRFPSSREKMNFRVPSSDVRTVDGASAPMHASAASRVRSAWERSVMTAMSVRRAR